MEIVYKDVLDLRPYESNPRHNENAVEAVKNSIQEFGFKVPMVVTSDGTIVAGHTRYAAAILLGMEEVPCVIADDLTDEQIRAFRLVDNKTAELSKWNMAQLEQELKDLLDVDMEQFGFAAPAEPKKKETKIDEETSERMVMCPHCGEWILESEARAYANS